MSRSVSNNRPTINVKETALHLGISRTTDKRIVLALPRELGRGRELHSE